MPFQMTEPTDAEVLVKAMQLAKGKLWLWSSDELDNERNERGPFIYDSSGLNISTGHAICYGARRSNHHLAPVGGRTLRQGARAIAGHPAAEPSTLTEPKPRWSAIISPTRR
jgi:hypothetical protein